MRNCRREYFVFSSSTWECEGGDFSSLHGELVEKYNNNLDWGTDSGQKVHDETSIDVINEDSRSNHQNIKSSGIASDVGAISHRRSSRERRVSAVYGEWYRRACLNDTELDEPTRDKSRKLSEKNSSAVLSVEKVTKEAEKNQTGEDNPEGHTSKQNSDAGLKFQCEICGRSYKSKVALGVHQRHPHSEQTSLACTICGKVLVCKSSLKLHQATHTDERPHKCETCGERFKLPQALKRHGKVHTGLKPFKCCYCEKTFAEKSRRKNHEATHDESKRHVCTLCGKSFTCSFALNRHKKVRHTSAGFPYKCNMCSKGYMSMNLLKDHVNTHSGENPYECTICHKKFATKLGIQKHRRSHIPANERPVKCQVCGKGFSFNQEMLMHMRSHQRGTAKLFKCKVCDLGFPDRNARDIHCISHAGEKV